MSSSVINDAVPVGVATSPRAEQPVAADASEDAPPIGADVTPVVASAADGKRGLSTADHVTLFAIGLVVLLVSLPRLRRFAIRENETDAIHALRILSSDALEHGEVLSAGGLGALLAASPAHQNRLADVELLDDGRLRRHGYLFDAVESAPGRWTLRAWPWEHGRTGLGAFRARDGALAGFANRGGRYSGPASPPPAEPPSEGWIALEHR